MAFVINNRRPLSRYRPPPHRSLRPLPPRWAEHEEAMRRSPLAQFILLSMLLHALAIMLFGAPSGGSREGRAMWGSLDVVIRGPLREEKPVVPEKEPVIPDASKEATVGNPVSPPVPPLLTIPPEAMLPALPRLEQVAPLPVEPLPVEPLPEPAPAPISELASIELPSMPHLERVEPLPIEELIVPVPAPPPVPAPAPEKEIAPIELEALPRMEALPTLQALPVEALPGIIERVEAPPTAAPAVEPPRAETPRVEPRIEAPALRESPFRPPASATPIGPGKDEPPSDYDPTAAPSLDAETLRRRAGEIARQGSGQRAVLAFPMPPIPERKTKLEEAIEKARKPDCRTAYQSLGLAAVIPLLANEFGEGSCRW